MSKNIIEVLTTLHLHPINNSFDKIDTKIVYSTVIELEKEKVKKEEIEKIILIDVPTEIYPELRNIFIFLFENSGFKDIKISETVDFKELYKMKQN